MNFSLRPASILLAALCGGAATVAAQPASATFRPALIESFASSYSYSTPADVVYGAAVGEVAVHHMEASFSGRARVADETMFLYGAAVDVNSIDAEGGVLLPDRLGAMTLNLGLTRRFTPQWSVSAFVRPGYYGDFENFSSDALNAPVLAYATYAQSAELVWLAGVTANPFSERGALPVVGVRWKFAPGWLFNLGFPRAGFSWEIDPRVTLRAGLSVQGGSYRITDNLGVPAAGVARLANTYVDYREIRVGIGAEWKWTERLSLNAEAGVVTDRRFEFYDRGYTLNGDATGFFTLGLNGRF